MMEFDMLHKLVTVTLTNKADAPHFIAGGALLERRAS